MAGKQRQRSLLPNYNPPAVSIAEQRRDVAALLCLQRFEWVPTHIWKALTGLSGNRITDLKRAGLITTRATAFHRHEIHALSRKGNDRLKILGLHKPHHVASGTFDHRKGECVIAALFALAAKETPGLRLITDEEILSRPSCPASTRNSSAPFEIPVAITYVQPKAKKPVPVAYTLDPDGAPTGFEYTSPSGKRSYLFIPGFEFDNHYPERQSEPLSPEDHARKSVRKALYGHLALGKGVYQTHYGIPNCITPFVAINEGRMVAMMNVLSEITGGKGSSHIVFKHLPNFNHRDQYPPANSDFLLAPWRRVGHEPFDFLQELKTAAERS